MPNYRFDDVVVDSEGFRILKDNETRSLTPRGFDVLLFLIKNQGRVVEKNELFEQIWEGLFVTDNALTRVIKEIRQAIGDDAKESCYIETIPKRGYKFIAQVLTSADYAENSLAVLPFVNADKHAEAEYLSDGITTSLINTLSRLSGMRVLARSSVFSYKGREGIAPRTIGKELNVGKLLTGKIILREDSFIIDVELADTRHGTHLWGKQYRQKFVDVFDVQAEIAAEISENLRLKLSENEQQQLTKRYTQDTEAYRSYLKGYYSLYKFTPDGLTKSFTYFNQAIEQDPNYALAFAGLVEAYFNLSFLVSPVEVWTKAKEAALRALQIDGTLAEAHYAMALVSFCYDRDLRTAKAEFKRAIELNPNYALAYDWYGWSVLAQSGRFDEALAELKKAHKLDPLSLAINTDFGTCLYWADGHYEEAIDALSKVVELENNFYVAHIFLGLTYLKIGNTSKAIEELQMAQNQSNNPVTSGFLGYALAVTGEAKRARQILDELLAQTTNGYVPPDSIAVIYLGLSETDKAFEWLQKACEKRGIVALTMKVEPIFDSIRSDPRFNDLLSRIGFTD